MSKETQQASSTADREIVTTRLIDAPRELVFRVWTDREHISNWWGPRGFTTTTQEMSVKPGGVWLFVMHGPDGTDYKNKVIFDEVIPNERIVYRHVSGPHFQSTITFADEGGKTRVTMRAVLETAELRDRLAREHGAVEGAQQTIARLDEEVARIAREEFVVTRILDAPRELVYKAWTQVEHFAQWWGPKGMKNEIISLDLRPGGIMHYRMGLPNGGVMWGRFVFREITPPERLVFVVSFSDEKAGVSRAPFADDWPLEVLSTVLLTEQAGKTTLTLRSIPINASPAERDRFVQMHGSMQHGWGGTLDQLASFLATQ